ncbi:MAG: hypothetical protein HKO62_01000 [Gammaproteobacteria bacterium]|nr:hypothetical protein [Gammaproteobacteria bacterium]
MKPGLVSCNIFMLGCIGTFWQSATLLGFGMWGWIILGAGVLVGISPHLPSMRANARAVALILVMLSCIALPLALLAAGTGGAFKLSTDEILLLLGFAMIAVSGIAVARATRRKRVEA